MPLSDRRHAELAHAVMQIIALLAVLDGDAALPVGQVRPGEVGGAAEELRHEGGEGLDGVLRGLAGGDRIGHRGGFGDQGVGFGGEVRGQGAGRRGGGIRPLRRGRPVA